MLSNKGFDLWADNYDQSVQISDENDRYPFAGYKEVLNIIFNEVMQKEESAILDIGFGTATLTSKLYEKGHQVDGVDFSARMIELAKNKMPDAHLLEWDITAGLPPQLEGKQYDAIISTYALHHLTDEAKIAFIHEMRSF